MALFEQIAGGKWLDVHLHPLTGCQRSGLLPIVTIAAAADAVGDVHRKAFRVSGARRVDIHQLGGEVGVRRVAVDPQLDLHRPGDDQVFAQGRGLKAQHIVALAQGAIVTPGAKKVRAFTLVEGAADKNRRAGCQRTAHGRHRVGRVGVVTQHSFVSAGRNLGQLPLRIQVQGQRLGARQRPLFALQPATAVLQAPLLIRQTAATAHQEHLHLGRRWLRPGLE